MKREICFLISIMLLIPGSHTAGEETNEETSRRATGEENQSYIPNDFDEPALFMSNDFGPLVEKPSNFPDQCLMCPPGSPGPRGPPGQQGLPGRGRRDVQLLSATSDDGSPPNQLYGGSGVTYVHWGKNTCPDQSPLVYEGVIGGKHYTHKGSATNYLCLHNNPTYDRPRAGASGGWIYGTEFEDNYAGVPGLPANSELACSVCLASSKRDVLMVPGVNSCPEAQGWTEEYHGYLMAAHYTHFATEFICVDHEAEGIPRTEHNNNPSLIYMVEGRCSGNGGGLPCPPYVDGYEITCVVCAL